MNINDSNGNLLGIYVAHSEGVKVKDVNFVTSGDDNLEVATMSRPKGRISPHRHNLVKRVITGTQEFLYLKSGSLAVDFYDSSGIFCKRVEMSTGDFVVLISGGHGFELHEHCDLIEVKNGPYLGSNDKTYF